MRVLSSTEKVDCSLRTLSAVIDEYGVEKIDLLKIDVEGGEADVLGGLEERHWGIVQQITLEVEDFAAVASISRVLEEHGFHVEHEASERKSNANITSEVSHMWAVRK